MALSSKEFIHHEDAHAKFGRKVSFVFVLRWLQMLAARANCANKDLTTKHTKITKERTEMINLLSGLRVLRVFVVKIDLRFYDRMRVVHFAPAAAHQLIHHSD